VKAGDEAKRVAGSLWGKRQNGAHKKWNRPVHCATENPGMGYGADRTLMARKLGIVSVYVDGLDDAGERHEEDT